MPALLFPLTGRANDRYTQGLSNAYNVFREIFNPSLAHEKDPDIWTKIRADAVFQVGINKRLNDIARPDWKIRPASKAEIDRKAASVVTNLFMQIANLKEARRRLAEGVFRGQSYEAIHGRRIPMSIDGGPALPWWAPTRLENFGHLRVIRQAERERGPDGRYSLTVKQLAWDIANEEWVEWTNPEWFVKTVWDDSEEWLGFGRGILEACYFYWWMKGQLLIEGLNGVKRWAQGTLDWSVDASAPGSVNRSSDEIQAEILRKVETGRETNLLIHDSRDKVEFKEMAGSGWQVVLELIRYLDDGVIRVFTGSLRPTGGGGGAGQPGAARQAGVEQSEAEGLVQFDRDKMADDITRDLVGLVWRLNASNLAAQGLAGANMPFFETPHERRFDPAKNAQVIQIAHQSGIPLSAEDVYTKLGLDRPEGVPDVIPPAAPAGPAMPAAAGPTEVEELF